MNNLILIACADREWGIGKNGGLLFHIPRDMARFKELTTNNIVIMGRKTLESLPGGKPLKDRINIVLTRRADFSREGVTVLSTPDELFAALKKYPDKKAFVTGGGEIYSLLLPYCSAAYITRVEADGKADTRMPDLDADASWTLAEESAPYRENGLEFSFRLYRRAE